MTLNIQNQHFHQAALIAFFWADVIMEETRDSVVSVLKWEDYIDKLIDKGDKKKEPNFRISKYKACNIMSSYLITKETEEKLDFYSKEKSFYNLAIKLYNNNINKYNLILDYLCNEEECKIVMDYFCMQLVRNPDNYIQHLNHFFADLTIKQENPYLFNIFDTINTEKAIMFINNKIVEDYFIYVNQFKKYTFKLVRNPKSNNMLTDSTVIKLNHNNYFKMLFKENYDKVESLFEKIYIITINQEYLLFFYPSDFGNNIDIFKDIYLKNQLPICLLYSRNIIIKSEQEESHKEDIQNFFKLYNKTQLNNFLKFYKNMNFPITAIENQLINYYRIKKLN